MIERSPVFKARSSARLVAHEVRELGESTIQ
jgi:hypothetical protein